MVLHIELSAESQAKQIWHPGEVITGNCTWEKGSNGMTFGIHSVSVTLECLEYVNLEAKKNHAARPQKIYHVKHRMNLYGRETYENPSRIKGGKRYSWPFAVMIPIGQPPSVHAGGSTAAGDSVQPAARCKVEWRLRGLANLIQRNNHQENLVLRVSGVPIVERNRFEPVAEARTDHPIRGGSLSVHCSFSTLPKSGVAGVVAPGESLRVRVTIYNTSKQSKPAKPSASNTVSSLRVRILNVWKLGNEELVTDRPKDKRAIPLEQTCMKEYNFRPRSSPNAGEGGFLSHFPLHPGSNFRADLNVEVPANTPSTINALQLFSLTHALTCSAVMGTDKKPHEVCEARIPLFVARPLTAYPGSPGSGAVPSAPPDFAGHVPRSPGSGVTPSAPPDFAGHYPGSPSSGVAPSAPPDFAGNYPSAAFNPHVPPSEMLGALHLSSAPPAHLENGAPAPMSQYGGNPAGWAQYGAQQPSYAAPLPGLDSGASGVLPSANFTPSTAESAWYFPHLSRAQAEETLRVLGGKAFLVRRSSQGNAHALSKFDPTAGRAPDHFVIACDSGRWRIDGGIVGDTSSYDSLAALVSTSPELQGFTAAGNFPGTSTYGKTPNGQYGAPNDHRRHQYGVSPAAQLTSPSAPPVYAYTPADVSPGECIICMANPSDAVLLECGHAQFCLSCGEDIVASKKPCPVCREPVSRCKRIFIA